MENNDTLFLDNDNKVIANFDLSKIHIPHYYLVFLEIFDLYTKGEIKTIYFKGSRMSAKTWFIVMISLFWMIIDPQASIIVGMENRADNSDRTMREVSECIERFTEIYPNYENRFIIKDSQVEKVIVYDNGKWEQHIKFVGWEEFAKKGLVPPNKTYWLLYWLEEVSQGSDKFRSNFEEKEQKLSQTKTFVMTSMRFLNRWDSKKQTILKDEKYRPKTILGFWTWNPENEEEPATKLFNSFLPENEENRKKMTTIGFDKYYDKETKQMFIHSNYLANPFLDKYVIQEFEDLKKNNPILYETDGYGFSAKTTDTIYESIWGSVVKLMLDKNFIGSYSDHILSIDVGEGGQGETTLVHQGYEPSIEAVVDLGEWGDKDSGFWKNAKTEWNPDILAQQIIKEIRKQEIKYPSLLLKRNKLIIDNSPWFESALQRAFRDIESEWKPKGIYDINLFTEKHNKLFKNEIRPVIFSYIYSKGLSRFNKDLAPKTYIQTKLTKRSKNGNKIQDGFDDFRQAKEMALYFFIEALLEKSSDNLIPKKLRELFYKIKREQLK